MKKYYTGLVAGVCSLALYGVLLATAKGNAEALREETFYNSIEESRYVLCLEPVRRVEADTELCFQLESVPGYEITGVTTDLDWELTEMGRGQYQLSVQTEAHPELITLNVQAYPQTITYHYNSDSVQTITHETAHRLVNTLALNEIDDQEGYTFLGWNTRADGSGTMVSAGSRILWESGMELYAICIPWAEQDLFTWEKSGDGVILTGLKDGQPAETLAIPGRIDGMPVYGIGKGALGGLDCQMLVLPRGLKTIEESAFADSKIRELYFCDDLTFVSDHAFEGNEDLTGIHIQAVKSPVYATGYFATFPDKLEALEMEAGSSKRLVLFSGSSARFGYDSPELEKAFPEYQVFDMGVFAYTNALPQLELIRQIMEDGDILLTAPEFDAAKRQFCTTNAFDYGTFALCESNYDLLSGLDLREFSQIFSAYNDFQQKRMGLASCAYEDSPAFYDEDQNPAAVPSYNREGDYVVYRPNAEGDTPVYGLEVVYTKEAFPEEAFLLPYEKEMARFTDQGVRVFMTYAPRNRLALSKDSDDEAIAELDQYFREHLSVKVLGSLSEALWDGRYLYGTDNHLSTEGAAIRTEQLIRELQEEGL